MQKRTKRWSAPRPLALLWLHCAYSLVFPCLLHELVPDLLEYRHVVEGILVILRQLVAAAWYDHRCETLVLCQPVLDVISGYCYEECFEKSVRARVKEQYG